MKLENRIWCKLSEELVSAKGDNNDWNYSSKTLDIKEMCGELSRKIKSIMKNIPGVIKISKQGDLLEKLRWDSNRQSRKKKRKNKAWKEYGIILNVENYKNVSSWQNEYEKLKHENKIVENILCNCKPLFKYVKSKTEIHKKTLIL